MDGWIYMEHEETGGGNLFPDKPDVISYQESRGWQVTDTPAELDPDAPNTGLGVHKPNLELDEEEEPPADEPVEEAEPADVEGGEVIEGDEK